MLANTSGSYWVTANSPLGCIQTDTVTLTFSALNAAISLPSDTLCRGTAVQFFDASTAATSWFWDFGNGNLSVNANPSTVYSAGGTFNVQLEVTDGLCTSTTSRLVYVDVCTGLNAPAQHNLQVYPNPSSTYISIEGLAQNLEAAEIKIMSIDGKVIYQKRVEAAALMNTQNVVVASFPTGSYILEIQQGDNKWIKKMRVQR